MGNLALCFFFYSTNLICVSISTIIYLNKKLFIKIKFLFKQMIVEIETQIK